MKVLMSIKPEYVKKIFSGKKEWEFRRVAPQPFSRNALRFRHAGAPFCIIIYASAPECKVVGEMMIDFTEQGDVESLLEAAKGKAGISRSDLIAYLYDEEEGETYGWGLHIAWVRKYERPLTLEEANLKQWKPDRRGYERLVKRPPQNYCYVKERS